MTAQSNERNRAQVARLPHTKAHDDVLAQAVTDDLSLRPRFIATSRTRSSTSWFLTSFLPPSQKRLFGLHSAPFPTSFISQFNVEWGSKVITNFLIGQLSLAARWTFQVKFFIDRRTLFFSGLDARPVSQNSYLGHTPASPSSPTFPNSVRLWTNICTDHRQMGCDDSP